MPQSKEPIKQRPEVEDESTGTGSEKHGKHREGDEALPGKGSTKGGMNRDAGAGRPSPADEGRGRQERRDTPGGGREPRP